MASRIGVIGGLSWEATAAYYRYLHHEYRGPSPWSQPPVVIDSLDMGHIVTLQRAGRWDETGAILADSARRLVAAGADVVAIGANTMHRNVDDVRRAVEVPVLDIRDCVATEVLAVGGTSVGVVGTTYVTRGEFFAPRLEDQGVRVVAPDETQADELQRIIYDELTQGHLIDSSRDTLLEIGASLVARGADALGLCCTEFGLLLEEDAAPYPVVDSTKAHVRGLLATLGETNA